MGTSSLQEVKNRMSKFTKRGVVLPSLKEPAASRPIVDIATPASLMIPLTSADGSVCLPVVSLNDTVRQGQLLAKANSAAGCSVLAPLSGRIVGRQTVMHPLLGEVPVFVLEPRPETPESRTPRSVDSLSDQVVLKLALHYGIVDELDGVMLSDKLSACRTGGSVCLVADASEQEPYQSSSRAVLNGAAEQVLQGAALAARAAKAQRWHVALRATKKEEEALRQRWHTDKLFAVEGRYPAEVVPAAWEATVCRVGVQACLALYQAAALDRPPLDCVITVAGDAVANPQNVRVPFGTAIGDVLHFCGLSSEPRFVILGDAMTGITLEDTSVPVIAGVTCLLANRRRPQPPVHSCIGCGRCVKACHADLLPYEIMRRLINMQYERLATLLAEECDGCGACSYVCPAGLDVTARVLEARDAHGNIFLDWGDSDDV